MANLKLNNVTAITESSGALTIASSTLTTPTIANMSNCTFPAGHILNSYYFAYTDVESITCPANGPVGTLRIFAETKTVNVPAGCSITCAIDGGRSHWGASYGSNHGLQINGVNYLDLHCGGHTNDYVPASMTKSVYISGGASSCTIKYLMTQRGSFSGESYLGGTLNTAHMLVLINKGDIT